MGTDRDKRGRFVRGNKAQMKVKVEESARRKRLPDMGIRQRILREVDELIESLAERIPDKPESRIALMYVADAMRHRASMELAFRMTVQTIDEAAYAKTGNVIPHGCLEAWNKNSQEMRRWLKAIGIDTEAASEDKTLEDVVREIESEA